MNACDRVRHDVGSEDDKAPESEDGAPLEQVLAEEAEVSTPMPATRHGVHVLRD